MKNIHFLFIFKNEDLHLENTDLKQIFQLEGKIREEASP